MSANKSDESLFSRLKRAQVGCSINAEQKFIPLDALEEQVTEEQVRKNLAKESGLATTLKMLRLSSKDPLPRRVVDQAKKVFAILVYIGEPDAIKSLLAEGLTDEQLPLRLSDDSGRPVSHTGKSFSGFATMSEQRVTDFIDRQWIVLAPSLDASGRHTDIDRRCPLPFEETEQTGHASTNAVYKSKIHPAHYTGPELPGNTSHVATKEFWKDEAFQREKDNLRTLASLSHPHLIKHLATFTRHSRQHYAIFPWADGGTLANFWLKQDMRVRGHDLMMWCLRQMLGISEAVQALHNVNCRHGDMKPENILHFDGPDGGAMVVADVGVSKSHEKATLARQGLGTETRATTPSYEAPEAFTNHSGTPRARRYDIWSIGCIFLEFSLWMLHDMTTINTFHDARHSPCFEFYLLNRDSSQSKRRSEIHPIVTKAFELLRNDTRCENGTVLERFINFIENRLLQVEVDKRAGADELVETLKSILRAAGQNPDRLLNNVDQNPGKLRFPKRAQTGDFEPTNGPIAE